MDSVCIKTEDTTQYYQIDFRELCNITVKLLLGFGLRTPIYNDVHANKNNAAILLFIAVC